MNDELIGRLIDLASAAGTGSSELILIYLGLQFVGPIIGGLLAVYVIRFVITHIVQYSTANRTLQQIARLVGEAYSELPTNYEATLILTAARRRLDS